ncbi:hypothetical protein PCANC_13574 [Puccinia coronata f. sp. avenae]|uniref:Uncharacterized protein n=1 Tax=Puccinia coronata f. sp. avenae TaxID=200324 RepID=A0A2N5SGH1_9BASI|nr:hypothetical protein PCANC_20850 [Puccinia coronata f. sp. avenae]PLW12309.1 hypothetical protein PCASD_25719 [Puccinia coronata f. sp. avenae]PLW35162.1 hypothetical protein PCASD_11249 [Puccinia coronata f. sp. avenae]PLW35502.1 hypothetical protein PCANC_13574 [Puccinia coronata f. sp. avenae]
MLILLPIFVLATLFCSPIVSTQTPASRQKITLRSNTGDRLNITKRGTLLGKRSPAPATVDLFACSESFAPLDQDQTLVFDQAAPETAGYCKGRESDDNLACALRSCVGSLVCSQCSRVTSAATDSKITTDGVVIPEPQSCELAYHTTGKANDPSLCLNGNLEVLQCAGACSNSTACSTCFKLTESTSDKKP